MTESDRHNKIEKAAYAIWKGNGALQNDPNTLLWWTLAELEVDGKHETD